MSSGLEVQPVSEGSLYFSTGVSEDYTVSHVHTQDTKAAQHSARLRELGGTLAASLNTPLAHAPQPPAGIAGGDHGASVRVREVVYQEHNTCSLLGSRQGHSESGCGDCCDTYCGLNTGCSLWLLLSFLTLSMVFFVSQPDQF